MWKNIEQNKIETEIVVFLFIVTGCTAKDATVSELQALQIKYNLQIYIHLKQLTF